jgi:hypothetical protein
LADLPPPKCDFRYTPESGHRGPGAIKKASELISDSCWNVEIIAPDDATYHPEEIKQLKERGGIDPAHKMKDAAN